MPQPQINLPLVVMRQVRLQGVIVGAVEDLRDMLAGMAAGGIRPAIDRAFAPDQVPDAFAHMAAGGHFGKIVVTPDARMRRAHGRTAPPSLVVRSVIGDTAPSKMPYRYP